LEKPQYLSQFHNKTRPSTLAEYARGKPYSDWHRSLDKRLLAQDIDYVEFRQTPNGIVPVAVIETTRVDGRMPVSGTYLNNIIDRYRNWSLKQTAMMTVADGLAVPAYIVLFRENCSEFWLNDFSDGSNDWTHFDQRQMEDFLLSL
jgi:hypothetical protein